MPSVCRVIFHHAICAAGVAAGGPTDGVTAGAGAD